MHLYKTHPRANLVLVAYIFHIRNVVSLPFPVSTETAIDLSHAKLYCDCSCCTF